MSETVVPAPATDAKGPLNAVSGLRLDELAVRISVLAAATPAALDAGLAAAGLSLMLGQKRQSGGSMTLRFWPDRCWVVGEIPTLPDGMYLTDISHGQSVLCLRGVEALHLLAQYASADLLAASVRRERALRCRIGPYDVTLWWDNTRDLRLALARSLAQSFVDFLRASAQRHWPEPAQT